MTKVLKSLILCLLLVALGNFPQAWGQAGETPADTSPQQDDQCPGVEKIPAELLLKLLAPHLEETEFERLKDTARMWHNLPQRDKEELLDELLREGVRACEKKCKRCEKDDYQSRREAHTMVIETDDGPVSIEIEVLQRQIADDHAGNKRFKKIREQIYKKHKKWQQKRWKEARKHRKDRWHKDDKTPRKRWKEARKPPKHRWHKDDRPPCHKRWKEARKPPKHRWHHPPCKWHHPRWHHHRPPCPRR